MLFWPEELRSAVEATYPYTRNTQAITSNDDDIWSIVQADSSYDPFPQLVYLGDNVSDGLFAWIQIGVNVSVDYSADDCYAIAAYLDEDGGYQSSSGMGGGGGGAPGGGNGTMPTGSFSGTPPSPTA